MSKKPNKPSDYENIIVKLIASAFEKDVQNVERYSILLKRLFSKDSPELSEKINNILGAFSMGSSPLRGLDSNPVPIDQESQIEMANIISVSEDEWPSPILNEVTEEKISNFIQERKQIDTLFRKNIKPSNSLLLIGKPGTGKTSLSYYLAATLNKNLIVLDLAISISSLLGKTGQNLKKVLNYARQNPSILLLDEFDAIAKKRDDHSDLGELKRVVNVLLMELDSWPSSSIIIATSNHPELLDRAVWRRFDHVIELQLPEKREIKMILENRFHEFACDKHIDVKILDPLSEVLVGNNSSDVCRYTDFVKRSMVLKNLPFEHACINELANFANSPKIKSSFIKVAKKILGDKVTVRELGKITGLSPSGVHHHLVKK